MHSFSFLFLLSCSFRVKSFFWFSFIACSLCVFCSNPPIRPSSCQSPLQIFFWFFSCVSSFPKKKSVLSFFIFLFFDCWVRVLFHFLIFVNHSPHFCCMQPSPASKFLFSIARPLVQKWTFSCIYFLIFPWFKIAVQRVLKISRLEEANCSLPKRPKPGNDQKCFLVFPI